jgi:2-amino-4-hydroxy-6-hydroxymethyldihydropteridine diphosphokinase
MSEFHLAYLNLGSNIQPEINLRKAVTLLQEYGEISKISSAWESKSVGAPGPNYLNACVLFKTETMQIELKERIIRPIEARLGRVRHEYRYAPRTIDIDIVLFDEKPCNDKFWRFAFVIVPLAEINPDCQNPFTGEIIVQTAARLRSEVWVEMRPGILGKLHRNSPDGQN